jgi:hypothetical protein
MYWRSKRRVRSFGPGNEKSATDVAPFSIGLKF